MKRPTTEQLDEAFNFSSVRWYLESNKCICFEKLEYVVITERFDFISTRCSKCRTTYDNDGYMNLNEKEIFYLRCLS